MPKVHQYTVGELVSISVLSRAFGMARETVAKRLQQCSVVPSEQVNGKPAYRLAPAVKAILGVTKPSGQGDEADPDQLSPQDRLAYWRSEGEKLKVALAKGSAIPDVDHEMSLAAVIKPTVQLLVTIPDILERECGLSTDAVDRLVISCDALRAKYHLMLLAE